MISHYLPQLMRSLLISQKSLFMRAHQVFLYSHLYFCHFFGKASQGAPTVITVPSAPKHSDYIPHGHKAPQGPAAPK